MKPGKIHIIGSVGSGKSTLARNLSGMLDIPYYELDNMVWRRAPQGDIRNSAADRDDILHRIVQSPQWIIEGVHHQWVTPSFAEAELIIFLDTPPWRRLSRITKRYLVQRLGLQAGNYKQSLTMLFKCYKWSREYEQQQKPAIVEFLAPYHDKLLFLKSTPRVEELLQK